MIRLASSVLLSAAALVCALETIPVNFPAMVEGTSLSVTSALYYGDAEPSIDTINFVLSDISASVEPYTLTFLKIIGQMNYITELIEPDTTVDSITITDWANEDYTTLDWTFRQQYYYDYAGTDSLDTAVVNGDTIYKFSLPSDSAGLDNVSLFSSSYGLIYMRSYQFGMATIRDLDLVNGEAYDISPVLDAFGIVSAIRNSAGTAGLAGPSFNAFIRDWKPTSADNLTIVDLRGREIARCNTAMSIRSAMNALAQGRYIVRLQSAALNRSWPLFIN